MKLHIGYFVIALLLLWTPRYFLGAGKWLFGVARKRKPLDENPLLIREPGDFSVKVREELVKVKNYIDFARAAAGGACLANFSFQIAGVELTPTLELLAPLMTVGVCIQTLRWKTHMSLYAPLFYLGGLTAGILGPQVGITVFVLAFVINAVLPNPTAFVCVQIPLLVGLGVLFERSYRMIGLAAGLLVLPILLGLALGQSISVVGRRLDEG